MTRPAASAPLTEAIIELLRLETEILNDEEALKDKKARRKTLGEHTITELVTEQGCHTSGVTLPDGTEWSFELDVHCGIRKDDKDVAFGWLAKHNADGMLKRHIVISFPKETADLAAKARSLIANLLPQYQIGIKVGETPETLHTAVVQLLTHAGLMPTVTLSEELELPGATLAAFVKRALKAGVNLPPEFGVYAPLRPVQQCTWRPVSGDTQPTRKQQLNDHIAAGCILAHDAVIA
jgi:hypothetical protein